MPRAKRTFQAYDSAVRVPFTVSSFEIAPVQITTGQTTISQILRSDIQVEPWILNVSWHESPSPNRPDNDIVS